MIVRIKEDADDYAKRVARTGGTGLNVMHLCTCLSCKPRPLHVRVCWYGNLSQS